MTFFALNNCEMKGQTVPLNVSNPIAISLVQGRFNLKDYNKAIES